MSNKLRVAMGLTAVLKDLQICILFFSSLGGSVLCVGSYSDEYTLHTFPLSVEDVQ